jgi:cystathionine beta-lyase/cystathionine gamma-synthase
VFSTPEEAERTFAILGGRVQAEPGESVPLAYARFTHPNAEILEDQILALEEGATEAAVFNSGMSGLAALCFTVCRPGTSIVYTTPLYGGSQGFLRQFMETWGVRLVGVPAGETDALRNAVETTPDLRLVLVETPANPNLVMADIAAVVEANQLRTDPAIVAVDNTLLGPIFQHPLAFGADVTLYSATKYLAGFSDMLAGVLMGHDAALFAALRRTRGAFGTILQPDESWLLNSRLPTVSLRMNRQSKNAQRIAEALADHAAVGRVYYPTLFTDPEQVRIRDAQCSYPGGLFSLDLRGGKPAAFEFLRSLAIGRDAVSLGGVETLACHPATTTHSGVPADELATAGITPGLVRVSIGIEDWRDLLADFSRALDAAAVLPAAA